MHGEGVIVRQGGKKLTCAFENGEKVHRPEEFLSDDENLPIKDD